jgi:uncharacterized protein YcbX
MYTLTAIYHYPVKGLAGLSVASAALTPRGLAHDRRWMIVTPEGQFLSQRQLPQMALLQPVQRGELFYLAHKQRDLPPLLLPAEPEAEPLTVTVWDDRVAARAVSVEADAWLSEVLGRPCRLVYQPEEGHRPVDPRYAPAGEEVSFADGYPYLIIGQAALDALNARLAEPVPMDRFRPNFVFSGGEPHAEDGWDEFLIGEQAFRAVKPCARCQVVTIDQARARRGAEPLRTLATYRERDHKVMFGMNLLALEGPGRVQVGDEIRLR